jgi:hypothetical protein
VKWCVEGAANLRWLEDQLVNLAVSFKWQKKCMQVS